MNTILVLRTGRLGDLLVAFPAFARLRSSNPGSRIVLLSGISGRAATVRQAASYADVVRPAWIDWICPRWVDAFIPIGSYCSIPDWLRVRRALGQEQISRVVILPFDREVARQRLKRLAWIRSLGVWAPITDGPNRLIQSRPPYVSTQMWRAWTTAACANPGESDAEFALPPFQCSERAVAAIRSRVPGFDSSHPTWVAIFAAATYIHKRWPADRFSEVASRLHAEFPGARFVFIGAEADATAAEEAAGKLAPAAFINLCGRTSLDELAAVFTRCRLFLGNDGGPAHLAAAVGVPCVTIMSGVHGPSVWDPASPEGLSIRSGPLPCAPCRNEFFCPAGHHRCMADITVDQVLAACRTVLRRSGAAAKLADAPLS